MYSTEIDTASIKTQYGNENNDYLFIDDNFQLESGSIETLIKLSNEGLGMTLLPYLHTLDMSEEQRSNLKHFAQPSPAREVSIIYHKSELKMQIIQALYDVISGIIRGAIAFEDVEIISPLSK